MITKFCVFKMQMFESFIPIETCNTIIKLCENTKGKVVVNGICSINQYRIRFTDDVLAQIICDYLTHVDIRYLAHVHARKSDTKTIVYNSFSYIRYENEGFVPLHTDIYDEDANYTLIIYLNDDYENGQTYIMKDSIEIKIEKRIGKAVLFKGKELLHGSHKVHGIKKILIAKIKLTNY